MWLLDTTVMIDCNRGRVQATEWLEAHVRDCALSVLTVAELIQGVRTRAERQAVDVYCRVLPVLPLTHEIAVQGGEYAHRYSKSHGSGLDDCLIAATAHLHGLQLATHNLKHYPMFKGLAPPYILD